MAVYNIPRKKITLAVPLAAYHSLTQLAAETNRSIPRYLWHLIACDLIKKGLPLYDTSKITPRRVEKASQSSPPAGGE